MPDYSDTARRQLVNDVNAAGPPEGVPRWTTEELQRDFEVEGFLAPFVVVRRRSDGARGTLLFTHAPRVYYDWHEA